MLKSTVLLLTLVAACAEDPSQGTASSLSTTTCEQDAGCQCDGGTPPPHVLCTTKEGTVDLTALNFANDDRVTFCHATSSPTNPFVVITTSVNACFAHETHEHLEQGGHLDIFAGGVCED